MAKSKKSKILAMALCASVMTGIYASPVMATELYVDAAQWVTTKVVGATQITSLEGLKEITLGDSVKITTDDKGIIRVGDAGGVNTRVHDDGFYVNTFGDDRNKPTETSLKAGTLTLAGNTLTSTQLANIKSVIDEVGGIRRAGTTDENRSTYIEKTVRVNNNSGLVVYAEDGTTFAAQIDREGNGTFTGDVKVDGNVLTEGVGRFGALEGPNVRMENGVLTVNSTGETDVAKLDAQGLTLTSGATEATLSAEQIARLNTVVTQNGESIVVTADHFKNTNNSFAVDSNGAVRAADGKFKVGANGAVRAADGKFNVGANGAVRAADGKFKVGAKGDVKAADERFIIDADGSVTATEFTAGGYNLTDIGEKTAGIKHIQNSAGNNITEIEDTLRIYDNGTISTVNGAFRINEQGNVFANAVNVADGTVVISENSINAFDSKFTVNKNGVVSTTGVNVAKGMFTASDDGVTMADGNMKLDTNGNITAGTYNGVKIGMNEDGDIILGDGTVIDDKFNSDNVAGITRKPLDDSAPGSGNTTFIEKNTAISADGIVVRDPGSGVSTKTKYDGFYVKDKYSNIVSSLKDDGLMLTDQESGETHTLNATDIADIKGIDRVDTNNDGTLDTTVIEKTLAVSETGIAMSKGDMQLAVNEAGFAAVKGDNAINLNESGVKLSAGNDNFVSVTQNGIGLQGGTSQVIMNSNNGALFRNGDKAVNGETVINGGTITTGSTTITSDSITTKTLNVDKIVLGDKIVDKETGEVIGELEIGADGSIKIDNAGTDAVEFNATKTALSANYGGTSLNMNSNGFNLNNGTGADAASLVLNASGFAFEGSLSLGKGSDVKYTGGNYGTLAKLDATVKDIYDRTGGIYRDDEGNTVISNETGRWNDTTQKTEYTGDASKVVVGANGTTFENGAGNGTTNIDGSKITSDANGTISGGSGSSTNSIDNPFGTSTSNGEETVYDGKNGNTNTVNSSGMTVTNGTSTTVIGAEKVDTTTGNFSDKVTVGSEGNQTVITGGDLTVDNSVTVGSGENQTIVNNDGVTVGGSDGVSIKDEGITVGDKNGVSIKNDEVRVGGGEDGKGGSYMNDTDVVTGEGVSLNQTAERVGHLENRVGKLEDRVDKVGAMAAAIANLRTMGYDPAAPTEVAVGIGQYRDETGAALGLFHYPNRDFMLSLSVSTSGDEVMGGIGATWKFGRKSPEKVAEIKKAQAEADARRAEEAKLAKAEEMKQAAKEAKIKAQQERHAKLAAERAAQAEAAK